MRIWTYLFFFGACCAPLSATAEPASCESVGSLAKAAMEARQGGVALQDLMPSANDLTKQLLIMAYEEPAYASERGRQAAITDFQNDVYLDCIKQRQ